MRRLAHVWMVMLVACSSAGETPDKVFKDRKAEMAAFVQPVRAAARTVPVLDADGLRDVQGPLITWLRPNGNTVVVTETILKEMHKGGEMFGGLIEKTRGGQDMDQLRMRTTSEFIEIANWATDNDDLTFDSKRFKSAAEAKTKLDHYLANRYVIVIRFLDYTAPRITSNDESTGTSKFEPGRLVAEARVLDMKGGDHGGFRFDAKSSDQLTAQTNRSDEAFASDLTSTAQKMFDAKLAKLVPGSSSLGEFQSIEKPSWQK